MTFLGILQYYLMIAPHLLLVGVVFCLARHKLYKRFPFFLAYVVFEILQFAVLFTLILLPSTGSERYALAYSIGLGGSTLLRFAVIYEVTVQRFRRHSAVSKLAVPLFRWSVAGLVLLALSLAAYTGGGDLPGIMVVVVALDRAASIVQCGLLLLLFGFSSYLGLSWRSHVLGIALGMGVFASVELANTAIRSHVGRAYASYLDLLTMATYHVCVLIWIWYLWAPEKIPAKNVQQLPEHNLEAWNQELQRFIQQ